MSKISISGAATGTATFTIESPATNTNRTLTLPDNTGTIITTASTFAGTGPAFSAYQSVQQTGIASATGTKITFTTEEYDTASCYTSSTFTPNVEGYYQINACIQMAVAATTASLVASIYKNGAVYKTGNSGNGNTVGGGINAAANVSSLVYCNGSTDYIEIYAYGSNNGSSYSIAINVDRTYFNGVLVRAA